MRVAEAVTEHEVAVMVVVPLPTSVASPFVPEVLLMVATAGADEDQVTALVTSLPPALAVNCVVPLPNAMLRLGGVMVMACCVPHTVTLAVPVIPVLAAVIVAVPGDTPVSTPVVGSMVAMLGADEDQAAVIAPRLLSLNTPMACICVVAATSTDGVVMPLLSVTTIEFRVGSTQKSEQPDSQNNPRTKTNHHLIGR